jgi:signal transduction histidine kinase
MRTTLSKQIESEKKAIQANNSLVTALSHDLRTPLTTQLGYLEILKEQHYTSEEERQEYLDKAIENGKQIKILSDRLFEYFLAFDRNTESLQQREVVDALELFMQLITEHTMYLEEIGFQFLLDEPEEQFFVEVNPEDCMRIFNNIFSNIEKYADKNETVIIRIHHTENQCEIMISNRIDRKPKKNESAKVGLESLRALMTRQGGQFKVERNNISFRTVLTFPVKEDHKV